MSTRNLTAGQIAALNSDTVRPALFAEIQTASGYERAWSGYNDITWGGRTFNGTGLLGSVSGVQETSEVYASGVTLSLSGVPSAQIALALGDMRQGRSVKIWLGFFDDAHALIDTPYLVLEGLTDIPTIDDEPDGGRISLSVENRLVRLEHSIERRWTPEDQHIDHPGDKGFDFVAGLVDAQITWGG